MPALSAILDVNLKQISEPGFGKQITSRQVAAQASAAGDNTSASHLWADPVTQTVMLRPRQLDKTWLNSTNALPWIIRLADLTVNTGDTSSGAIIEQPAFGNTDNPWIYHIATLPTGYFPAAPGPLEAFPSTGPNLLGIDPGVGPSVPSLTAFTVRPTAGYQLSTTMPAAHADPSPVQVVDETTLRHVGMTAAPLLANQAILLRWYYPPSQLGFPAVYRFWIGQFIAEIKDTMVQIWQDDSAHGDRSHFRPVVVLELFAQGNSVAPGVGSLFQGRMEVDETTGQERSLLWLPFRRNQVLLCTPNKSAVFQTRPAPQRLADNTDWDIVRSDKLIVSVLSPVWSRFQIQRLAYAAATMDMPTILLDYTPATVPDHTLSADTDHGTQITVVRSSPPSYSIPLNNAVECPNVPANITSYQARAYGYELTLVASIDGAWTPFFYNFLVSKTPILVNSTATPKTISDTTAGSPSGNQTTLVSAEISAGRKPGEGRASFDLWDYSPYPSASYYYRCGYPVQLKNATTPVFTGYTTDQSLRPLKVSPGVRQLTVTAADRWYQLTNYYLRENRNWAGTGHIDVVQNIMQQAGIDTTGMDTPPKNAQYNQILGDLPQNQVANEVAGQTVSPWQPHLAENASTFLRRIAEHFSGWDIGFDAAGVPFYLPKYYYSASEVTLYETAAAATADGHTGAPLFYNANFSTIEPEANAVLVKGTNRVNGQPLYSSLWIDWASILNPAKVNYMGRRKTEIIDIAGAYSCAGINWAARTIWNQTRRRHIIARFECDWNASVKVAHVLTLHGYGAYRVISYSVRFRKGSFQRMQVEAELVETGY